MPKKPILIFLLAGSPTVLSHQAIQNTTLLAQQQQGLFEKYFFYEWLGIVFFWKYQKKKFDQIC